MPGERPIHIHLQGGKRVESALTAKRSVMARIPEGERRILVSFTLDRVRVHIDEVPQLTGSIEYELYLPQAASSDVERQKVALQIGHFFPELTERFYPGYPVDTVVRLGTLNSVQLQQKVDEIHALLTRLNGQFDQRLETILRESSQGLKENVRMTRREKDLLRSFVVASLLQMSVR